MSPHGAEQNVGMSLDEMSSDLVSLLKSMYPKRSEAPAFLLVGHSMVSLAVYERNEGR